MAESTSIEEANDKTPEAETPEEELQDLKTQLAAATVELAALTAENSALKERVEQQGAIIANVAPAAAAILSLKDYKYGMSVDVMKDGDWLVGTVNEVTPWGVSVHTERGPISIGTTNRIRTHVVVAPVDPAEAQIEE